MGLVTRLDVSDIHRQLLRVRDLGAVHRLDHVTRLQTGFRRRAIGLNAGQQRAGVRLQMHRLSRAGVICCASTPT